MSLVEIFDLLCMNWDNISMEGTHYTHPSCRALTTYREFIGSLIMANLCTLFQEAELQFKLQRETPKRGTMEVLKYKGRGVAWRWMDRCVIQLCPPTKGRKTFRDGHYLVIQGKEKECRYRDPQSRLNPETWSYAGCDCTNLSDERVWEWIETAYKYQEG